ncbi:hypothetical protein BKA63DRAFT_50805 [Paraphoma chrysanthemicola]|nr:hypothetical protein BKA63DRAFT_50805 [Paraphoma chrysanthemicola]
MRLIHIQDDGQKDGPLQLSMVELTGSEIDRKRYAILSHRWREDEVLFVDMAGDGKGARLKKGYSKVMSSCRVAYERGYHYLWCDTCCIRIALLVANTSQEHKKLPPERMGLVRTHKGTQCKPAY